MQYTNEQLDSAAILDLLSDAESSEAQAVEGPFYPERGITPASLIAYATHCRGKASQYASGGAHKAVLSGLVQ